MMSRVEELFCFHAERQDWGMVIMTNEKMIKGLEEAYLHYDAHGIVRDLYGNEIMVTPHECTFNHKYYWAKVSRYLRKIEGYSVPGEVTLTTYDRKVCDCGEYVDETCNSLDIDHIEFDKNLGDKQ
jgi:hypothetical protein